MHPILAQRTKLGLYLAAWLMVAVLLAMLTTFAGTWFWREALVAIMPMMLLYAFVCLSTWYLCRVFTLERSSILQLFGVFSMAGFFSAGIWLALGKMWVEVLAKLPAFAGIAVRYAQNVALLLGAAVLLFWLMAVVHYLFVAFENTRTVEKRLLQLELFSREAELQSLKAQIHPHFLFNSLHAISALTAIDAKAARDMCLRLSDFLRKSLALKAEARIPLAEELRLLENYLALEQVRFGTRLRVEMSIASEAGSCLVPALLLQPLLENAVNHGIAHLVEGGNIALQAHKQSDSLVIIVTNPCDPERAPRRGEGLGLQNVSRRLATMYGAQAQLACEARAEFFRVKIVLPCEETLEGDCDALRNPAS